MTKTNLKTFMFEKDNLDSIKAVLENGGLILYPTDTIWGIGCDATNEQAVENVYELKQRDRNKGFIILVDSIEMMKKYVAHVHPRIDTLLLHHIRPLTVVFSKAKNLPPNVLAPDGSIAIRIVQDDFCRDMIRNLDRPIIATSANIGDKPFPGNFGEISSAVIEQVDYVCKQRRYEKSASQPSVMVRVEDDGELVFIRE